MDDGATKNKAQKIGKGSIALVYYPALECQEWSTLENKKNIELNQVTKLSVSASSLAYNVHVAILMKKAWKTHQQYWKQHLQHPCFVALRATPTKRLIISTLIYREPEEFFNLPDTKLCLSCVLPNKSDDDTKDQRLMGMYLPKLELNWKAEFAKRQCITTLTYRDLRSVRHLIVGVLLAHFLGFTHNDLHHENIMFHKDGRPRIIDWEQAICFLDHTPFSSSQALTTRMTDQMPDDWHQYMAFWRCKLFKTPKQQIAADWAKIGSLCQSTFRNLQDPYHCGILATLSQWLDRGTDEGMRAAVLQLDALIISQK
jgi:hypothetical protein